MKLNPQYLKRWSTFANLIGGALAFALSFLPQLDLSTNQAFAFGITLNVVIAACQLIKQEAAND
ncbi:hypothetical protein N9980_00610 [bacterium]|nr:hypothetical protein [bacterium]